MENYATEQYGNSKPVSVGDWFVTILLTSIPLVNLIMLLVWAFGDGTPRSKANWAKATLLWFVVIVGLYLLVILIFGATLLSMRANSY